MRSLFKPVPVRRFAEKPFDKVDKARNLARQQLPVCIYRIKYHGLWFMLWQDDLQVSFRDRRPSNEGGLQGDAGSGNRRFYQNVTFIAVHLPSFVATTVM